jgi:hypothetical protein
LKALSQKGFTSLFRWGLYLGFSHKDPYWFLRAYDKTQNISHATKTGLESAFKKQLSPTVLGPIENSPQSPERLAFP